MVKKLSLLAEKVLKEAATEAPFTSKLLHEDRDGVFRCAGCGAPLFTADTKFDSGTGWPSFDSAIPGAVTEHTDSSLWMKRVEFRCAKCNGHLGHIFDDGPTKTKMRYCTNGCALDFKPKN